MADQETEQHRPDYKGTIHAFGALAKGLLRASYNAVRTSRTAIAYKNFEISHERDKVCNALADAICHKSSYIPNYMGDDMAEQACAASIKGKVPPDDVYPDAFRTALGLFEDNDRLEDYAYGIGNFILRVRRTDPDLAHKSTTAFCDMSPDFIRHSPETADGYFRTAHILLKDVDALPEERLYINASLERMKAEAEQHNVRDLFREYLGQAYDALPVQFTRTMKQGIAAFSTGTTQP